MHSVSLEVLSCFRETDELARCLAFQALMMKAQGSTGHVARRGAEHIS